jgi:hypothetical protein
VVAGKLIFGNIGFLEPLTGPAAKKAIKLVA